MLSRNQFSVALTVAVVASEANAKEWYGKHTVNYLHGDEKQSDINSMLAEREAAYARGDELEKLTIHLVPHTHDDIGWLKTIDEYYSGSKMETAIANAVHGALS